MEALIPMNNQAVEMFFGAVRKMPEDKQTWKPLDEGRSALEQAQELATAPALFLVHLAPNETPIYSSFEEASAAGAQMDLNACEAECKRLTGKINEAISTMTPEQMAQQHKMPWGMEHSGAEVAGFHYWNVVYHVGQVNYIQTLYGDHEM